MSMKVASSAALIGWLQVLQTSASSMNRESWHKFSELKRSYEDKAFSIPPTSTQPLSEIYADLCLMLRDHREVPEIVRKVQSVLKNLQQTA